MGSVWIRSWCCRVADPYHHAAVLSDRIDQCGSSVDTRVLQLFQVRDEALIKFLISTFGSPVVLPQLPGNGAPQRVGQGVFWQLDNWAPEQGTAHVDPSGEFGSDRRPPAVWMRTEAFAPVVPVMFPAPALGVSNDLRRLTANREYAPGGGTSPRTWKRISGRSLYSQMPQSHAVREASASRSAVRSACLHDAPECQRGRALRRFSGCCRLGSRVRWAGTSRRRNTRRWRTGCQRPRTRRPARVKRPGRPPPERVAHPRTTARPTWPTPPRSRLSRTECPIQKRCLWRYPEVGLPEGPGGGRLRRSGRSPAGARPGHR